MDGHSGALGARTRGGGGLTRNCFLTEVVVSRMAHTSRHIWRTLAVSTTRSAVAAALVGDGDDAVTPIAGTVTGECLVSEEGDGKPAPDGGQREQ